MDIIGSRPVARWTSILGIIVCAFAPLRAVAQTPRTTANQGLAAHYGWQDPDGAANGNNDIPGLLATDDKTIAAASRLYNKLGDPTINFNLPAKDSNYTVQFKLIATTPTLGSGQNSTINAYVSEEYSVNGSTYLSIGSTSQVTAARSFPGQTTTTQVFTVTLKFAGGQPVWIRLILRGTASGNVGGGEAKVQVFASSGWASDPYAVTWIAGPQVSVPYSANLYPAANGMTYAHATPEVGSMGTTQALALTYNSTAARPVSLVYLDVTGPPSAGIYEFQVQLVSNGAYLTLLNNATAVYYTATASVVGRVTAAIDGKANGLATGSYPVNLVLTMTYGSNTQTAVIPSRIMINDQTASPFGAGVGLSGVGHLYTMTGSLGRLLVGGGGAMDYFDRTCQSCAFVSPTGESSTLVAYDSMNVDTLFQLTNIDGSFATFNRQGYMIRHNMLPSVQDLTLTWNISNQLTGVTDASGRGFTLSYIGGFLTQITDFASRVTSTGITSGLLRKVTDADGGFDSLFYNGNNLLDSLQSRTGSAWGFGYDTLRLADSTRAPKDTDYTGSAVRPISTAIPAAEAMWQPSIAGTTSGAPKGSVRADTIYGVSKDPLGHITKTQFDRFGQVTKVVDALSQVTTIARDTLGNATWVHGPTGHAATARYIGYFPISTYDSSTAQTVTYAYGRSTAGQGVAAADGWHDPDGAADGQNSIALAANDDKTIASASALNNTLGDPAAGSNLPAVDSNYTVQFKLTASTPTVPAGNNSTIIASVTTQYSINSGSTWTTIGGTSADTASLNTPGQLNISRVFTPTLHFAGGGPVWIRLILRGTASGTLSGGSVKVQVFATTGWGTDPYPVLWFTNSGGSRLLAVIGGSSRIDYLYHDGTQGPAGALKQVYLGNTLAPGTVPSGGASAATHYPNAYAQDTLVLDGLGHKTRWTYATAANGGNLTQSTDALGHTTGFHYNGSGLVDTSTLANGVKQSAVYDLLSRDTISTNGLGYATRFTYSSPGLTRVTDARHQVYKFDLNAWSLTKAQYDLGDTTRADRVKFDSAGEVRTITTRRGQTITLTYDALGRLTTKTGPDFPAESLSYGLLAAGGSWTVAASSNGRDSLAFDKAGRLVYSAQQFPGGDSTYVMSYTYDSTGHLTNRSAPPHGTTARWVYRKNLGVLDTMCAVGTCTAVARDSELKPDTFTYNAGAPNSWWQILAYDSLHEVRKAKPTATFQTGWAYDSLGRVKYEMQDTLSPYDYPREVFRYDAAGQLVGGCQKQTSTSTCNDEYTHADTIPYKFDSTSNRIDTTAHSVVGAGNRVTQFKGYALYYDANGADTLKAGLGPAGTWHNNTDTTRYTWNAEGELIVVEKWPANGTHTTTKFCYDALGRRVGKSVGTVTTWFVYDGDQVEMDLDSATHTMKAEYGFTDAGTLYAFRTPTDTAIIITTPTIGTVLGTSRARGGATLDSLPDRIANSPLFPWGQEPADTGFIVRYRMGEQEYDQETGLYHMGARYYDPVLGRWLSEDPAGIVGGINLYAYAGNDPVNGRDPSGLWQCRQDSANHVSCSYDPSECPSGDYGACNTAIVNIDCKMHGGHMANGVCIDRGVDIGGLDPTGDEPYQGGWLDPQGDPRGAGPGPTLGPATPGPERKPLWNSCVASALAEGGVREGIDAIGLIPEAGGIARVVGHQFGYVGKVAIQQGGKFIKAAKAGVAGVQGAAGFTDTSPGGLADTFLTAVGFIPGLGTIASGVSMVVDAVRTGFDVAACYK